MPCILGSPKKTAPSRQQRYRTDYQQQSQPRGGCTTTRRRRMARNGSPQRSRRCHTARHPLRCHIHQRPRQDLPDTIIFRTRGYKRYPLDIPTLVVQHVSIRQVNSRKFRGLLQGAPRPQAVPRTSHPIHLGLLFRRHGIGGDANAQ